MRKKVYGFSESAAGEIGEVLNRYRAGFLGSPAPKSRHRENAPRASAAPAEYNGYFKVIDVAASSPAQIKIIDGANPAASICGMADILASVPVATITKTSGTIVYAIASYSSSVFTVTFQCSGTTPTGSVGYIPIASIAGDGTIRQLWVSNRLVFRSEFLI